LSPPDFNDRADGSAVRTGHGINHIVAGPLQAGLQKFRSSMLISASSA
jgi:hypothetical protein